MDLYNIVADNLILLSILLLPLFLGVLRRVSSSHIFFSVMAGELLGRYFGHEAEEFVLYSLGNLKLASYSEAIIITLPIILTALFLRNSISRLKMILHIVPLAITGVIYAVFLLPTLPESTLSQIRATQIGEELLNVGSLIIGAVIFIQLVALWFINKESKSKKKEDR